MMPMLLPMLATPAAPFDSEEYLFELKWDGVRALAARAAWQARCRCVPIPSPRRSSMKAKKKHAPKTPPAQAGKAAAKTQKAAPAPASNPTPQAPKPSALAAAARVLAETGQAMTCPELIVAMASKGYWTSPAGKTPSATLYAALTREIQTKKDQARFRKSAPGKFVLA